MSMSTASYSLRTLFLITAVVAISCAFLAKPSPWAAIIAPILYALLIGVAASKAIATKDGARIFWTSFTAILVGYVLTTALSVSTVDTIAGPFGGNSVWLERIAYPVWQFLHGNGYPSRNSIINGYGIRDYAAFMVTLHLLIAVTCSLAGALVCRFFAHKNG